MKDLIRLEKLRRDIGPKFIKTKQERAKLPVYRSSSTEEHTPNVVLLDQDENPLSYSKVTNHSKDFVYDSHQVERAAYEKVPPIAFY